MILKESKWFQKILGDSKSYKKIQKSSLVKSILYPKSQLELKKQVTPPEIIKDGLPFCFLAPKKLIITFIDWKLEEKEDMKETYFNCYIIVHDTI